MSLLIVEFQAFRNNEDEFVVKELAVGDLHGRLRRFLFYPPYPQSELHHRIQISNKWCTDNLHGIEWDDGNLPYSDLSEILFSATNPYRSIVTKGRTKSVWLSAFLKRKVFDLDTVMKFRMNLLPKPIRKCDHNGVCAKINVIKIRNWMQELSVIMECNTDEEASSDDELHASRNEGMDTVDF